MQILFVIIAFALLYLFRLPTLQANQSKRDLVVFSILMFVAFMISILAVMGVEFPYMTTEIMKVFKWVYQ